MTPEARRAANEALLTQLGIPTNPDLLIIEGAGDTALRSEDELWRRLVALWGVVGAATLQQNAFLKNYFSAGERRAWLSNDEAAFLFNDTPDEGDAIRFSWRLEALYFLGWCAGLVEDLGLPVRASKVDAILPLFPHDEGDALMLRAAIRLRPKEDILDWADRLVRMHWAVRDAQQHGREAPAGLNPGVVLEWHHAVNWMIRYKGEDDWDSVGTAT
ncbi:DUF4272 domain-containing protein [Massilia consociata]|uniref:DUF4272 domain-containing protein n=1 Tax=Massilia consociata TaxID=760117 RepID=A0ABV6FM35_9BURK